MSWAEVKNLKDKMSDIANSTLHIEGGTDLAGQEVIIKRYDSDYMKATLDSTGSLEVEVTPKSKYRVTSNDADLSKRSQDIEVGTGDLVNVELSYRKYIGKDVLPVDDVPTWLACHPTAGSYKYTTMEQVLKDSACLIALLSNQNSLDYLMRSPSIFRDVCNDASACAQFASMEMCNMTLLNTPIMIPIATASSNCDKIFPWSLPRVTKSFTSEKYLLTDNFVIDSTPGSSSGPGTLTTGTEVCNAFTKGAYVPSVAGTKDYATTNRRVTYPIEMLQDVNTTGVPPMYKYVPKCLIINAPAEFYDTGKVPGVTFSGRVYGTDTWETLGEVLCEGMTSQNSGKRYYMDIADNDKEYVEFSFKLQLSYTGSSNTAGAIGNIQMLGYRFAYEDGRRLV